jgi:hypothetical protein
MSLAGESADHGEVGTVGETRLLTMLMGTVTGVAIAASSWKQMEGDSERNKWLIFLLVAGLLGAAAGEAFGFGLNRWREVTRYHRIRLWRVWLSLTVMLVIAASLITSARYAFDDTRNLSWRGVALAALAIVGGLSSAAVARSSSSSISRWPTRARPNWSRRLRSGRSWRRCSAWTRPLSAS